MTFAKIGTQDLNIFGAKKSFFGLFESYFGFVQKFFMNCF